MPCSGWVPINSFVSVCMLYCMEYVVIFSEIHVYVYGICIGIRYSPVMRTVARI